MRLEVGLRERLCIESAMRVCSVILAIFEIATMRSHKCNIKFHKCTEKLMKTAGNACQTLSGCNSSGSLKHRHCRVEDKPKVKSQHLALGLSYCEILSPVNGFISIAISR